MSYGIFLLRFEDGGTVPLDHERFRRLTEPYAVVGGPGEEFSQLLAEDGSSTELYGDGREGLTFTHVEKGAVLGVIARLAVALGASIVPQDGPTVLFHEERRAHLPEALRDGAVVTEPTADGLLAALEAR
ncbi:hypothetical protein ACIA8O_32510 [Kitasatospora sp. NPDC051853]|uniref:hypothetical protein n=1 Tax=Kitasatospora sp. NPDC051853 TaxID=3364058 RepID=UPI00378EDF49